MEDCGRSCYNGDSHLLDNSSHSGTVIFSSFRATKGVLPFEATTYTFSNYVRVFTSKLTYTLLVNTLHYATISLTIGMGLAVAFAWFLERTNVPGRSVMVALVLTPLGVPGIVETMAWILALNPTSGLLNSTLRELLDLTTTKGPINIYSIGGMGFVTGLKLVPSAYIMIGSVMARLDPSLEEASLTSGASKFTTFRRITGALMRPALLSVLIYFGVQVIEMFETPALLGMPVGIFVFSTLIYNATHPSIGIPDFGLASGYAIISLMIGAGLSLHVSYACSAARAVCCCNGQRVPAKANSNTKMVLKFSLWVLL